MGGPCCGWAGPPLRRRTVGSAPRSSRLLSPPRPVRGSWSRWSQVRRSRCASPCSRETEHEKAQTFIQGAFTLAVLFHLGRASPSSLVLVPLTPSIHPSYCPSSASCPSGVGVARGVGLGRASAPPLNSHPSVGNRNCSCCSG